MTPSQRTAHKLAADGYTPFKTEHWDHYSHKRHDLFGFADYLALKPGEVCVVQTTTADHLATRVRKIVEHDNVGIVREAGIRIEVWGWYPKPTKKYPDGLRVVDVS